MNENKAFQNCWMWLTYFEVHFEVLAPSRHLSFTAQIPGKFIALKVYIRNKENITFVTIRFAFKKQTKKNSKPKENKNKIIKNNIEIMELEPKQCRKPMEKRLFLK